MFTTQTVDRAVRLGLQAVLVALSLVMLWHAVMGLIVGGTPYFAGKPPAAFDNQARYVAGVYLIFPFLIWWMVPTIERQALPIRILAAGMVCGGIGRLISLVQFGSGADGQLVSLGVEIGSPFLILWQRAVAMAHERKGG